MFLTSEKTERNRVRFLHACGDVSSFTFEKRISVLFSPRMWRCFAQRRSRMTRQEVFSTHVEMFLRSKAKTNDTSRFLHACGDVSAKAEQAKGDEKFSPRMWRCFSTALCVLSATLVFFTHVEMFLFQCFVRFRLIRFLHACGDVSGCSILISTQARFSPRMWRCFFFMGIWVAVVVVFSTHVEMFLLCPCCHLKAMAPVHWLL